MKRHCIIIGTLALAFASVLALTLSQTQRAGAQNSLAPQSAQRAVSASSCGAIEIPLDMGDPFAIAYNPVNDYVYVLRTGTSAPQAAVLHYGREVARISLPSGAYRELTSIGVNPHSGLTYVTQWSVDRVHFISGTQYVGSYSTGYWGPAGVWSGSLTDDTYVSGKWYDSTSKVVRLTGTVSKGSASAGYNANPNAGVVAENNQYLYLANSNLDTVSVIAGNSLLATLNVGDHPNGIAYNPVNGLIYVVNRGTAATSSTVSVISGTAVVATTTLGLGYNEYLGVNTKDAITLWGNVYRGGTDIVTVDSTTGYVYVSNWGANTVSVISGTTLLATLPVGVNPNSIAYNPVTGLVYVANTGSDTVTVIQGTSVIKTVPVGDYPIGLAVDTHSGLVYAVNRRNDSLSVIRCEDNRPEKRVLGHYMTWYKTPITYTTPACVNPDARGEWRMWNMCGHDPDIITGTHGFRDISAVHYPPIGPYDSADPKVIEYHRLQALAAEIDTFVIDYYGASDPGGIDEASLQVLRQVEDMNIQHGTNFRIALMYDEGALVDQPDPLAKAMTDTLYMLHTYAASPAYLWANGKPVLFYFPKGPILSPAQLATVAANFSLVYPDFLPDYLAATNGAYAWVKAEPWQPDGSDWGESYLDWFYPTLDFTARTVPTLTFSVGAVWAGFNDVGVGQEWSCDGCRWIDRQGGQVYNWTWDVLNGYNAAVGMTYTHPVSWVQLATLNDYMEGTTLLASVEIPGVDGVDYGYGYGYQYVQQTENHASAFKGLPADDELDIYVAQHIYDARLVSGTISNTALINSAVAAFHSGHYAAAMALADRAAGIPAPISVTAAHVGDNLVVSWQDQAGTTLASGHRVYYGLQPGKYVSSTEVLTGLSVVLTGLTPETTYYVAVTTLGTANPCETWYVSESWYSDEVMAPPAPTGVTIRGPITGVVNDAYTFSATVTTTVGSAALPLTYVWEATGQPAPVTHTNGGLTDTVVFTWSVPGSHTITVMVANSGGAISATHTITLKTYVYLPLILRRYPPIPDTPILNLISDPDSSGNYDVSWNDAYLAETYTLEEDNEPDFHSPTVQYPITTTSWSAVNHPAGTYYYRVKASNTWGDSGWSNVQSVLVVVCTVTWIETGNNPFAAAYNPVNDYVYVLGSGDDQPQAIVLQGDHEVGRIDFPSGEFRELTSVGVNPVSGLVYVTQWGNDTVHFINGLQKAGSYRTDYWGTAGVWPSPLTGDIYVSGKWYASTSKVVRFVGTKFKGLINVGYNANPNAGVVAENNQYLYLANSYADTVSVIAGNSLLATINVGDHPNGIVYNPVNGHVYVVNRGTAATQSTVSVINGTQVVATITLGPGYDTYLGVHPKDAITLWNNMYNGSTDIVTVDPTTGYVYVSNWGAGAVSILSGTGLLATVSVGGQPNSIAYNPATGMVYVANSSGEVALLKGTNLVTTVPVGPHPVDLAVDARDGSVYVVHHWRSDEIPVWPGDPGDPGAWMGEELSLIRCADNP